MPSGFMNALEAVVEFVRDAIVQPNVGQQVGEHLDAAHPDVLRLHPLRERDRPDSDLRRPRRCSITSCCTRAEDSFVKQLMHGGTTATANFNVTAALATITFGAIIVAGSKAHGFVKHWKNLVPHGLRLADLHPADPDRNHGHVRPAVRADDATCGEHDGRPHRDSGDSVVRVPLHGDVRPARSPASASAWRSRCRWRSASRRSRSSSSSCRRTCSRC